MISKFCYGTCCLLSMMMVGDCIAKDESNEFNPKLFGFIQADYYSSANNTQLSSFHIRRARLGVKGKIDKNLSYNLLGAYEGGNASEADIRALNVFLRYQVDPSLSFRLGQFKYHFDREGYTPAHSLPALQLSLPTSRFVTKLGQTGSALRDIGLEASGKIKMGGGDALKYSIGMINGNGINKLDENVSTTSSDKDLYTRLQYDLDGGLSLGAAVYQGTRLDGSDEVLESESIWTVDASYDFADTNISGVFTRGKYSKINESQVPKAYSVTAVSPFTHDIDGLIRYSTYSSDSNRENNQLRQIDFGVNYYLTRKGRWGGTKLMVNYALRSADSAATSRIWGDRGILVQGGNVANVWSLRLQVTF